MINIEKLKELRPGQQVYIANAYEWTWQPYASTVIDIEGDTVWCTAKRNTIHGEEENTIQISKSQIFEHSKEGLKKCNEYIRNYYYDGLCRDCKYDNCSGHIFRCNQCSHCKDTEHTNPIEPRPMKCEYTGITVGEFYHRQKGMEICKKFDPVMDSVWKSFRIWGQYDDVLRNCEFNRECNHHKYSCHKTCTYEQYMNEIIKFPFDLIYNDRKVTYVLIKRSQWVNQDFISDGKLLCYGLDFEWIKNKNGTYKAHQEKGIYFDKLTEVNINGND